MKKLGYVVAAVLSLAITAPTLASAATIVVKHGHPHHWHPHHHHKVVIIKHRH